MIKLEHDMLADLKLSAMIKAKVQRGVYAQNLYAAMCNMQWQRSEVVPILRDELWSVSWRRAGEIVAELRGQGDYLDWYCSGISGGWFHDRDHAVPTDYVAEGTVTNEIQADLAVLGWHAVEWNNKE